MILLQLIIEWLVTLYYNIGGSTKNPPVDNERAGFVKNDVPDYCPNSVRMAWKV
jgi:hypothetical protein